MKPKIPRQLLEDMYRALNRCHMDENRGVPIGARVMAFEVLAHFADDVENAAYLELGSVDCYPRDWARENCLNPDRSLKDQDS